MWIPNPTLPRYTPNLPPARSSLTIQSVELKGDEAKATLYRSGMPVPPVYFGQEADEVDIQRRMKLLKNTYKIKVIVLLQTKTEIKHRAGFDLQKRYEKEGFNVIHVPIVDYHAPKQDQLIEGVNKTVKVFKEGHNILVHCFGGVGRTMLFVGCLGAYYNDTNYQETLNWVRKSNPSAIETKEQEQSLSDYVDYLRSGDTIHAA